MIDSVKQKGKGDRAMKKIAFIGLGIMGKSMARNVMKKGYELNIYARTRSKVSDLEQEGAVFYETIPACVKDADAVITIVGYPKDVEEVYFGENGILQNAKQGTYVIDMTTSSPKIAEKIDREAKERGLHALDAPEGAVFYETIPACVKDADAVITIVGYPKDVEEVYFGENGILQNAKQGTYVIDMTTSSPKIAEKIDREAKERGLHALDAPVTGGDTGAKAGTLSILVGGAKEDYESCLPLFEAMGNNINYEGAAGAGQNTKLANQIMIAGTISGLCEALSYAKAKGLDLQTLLDSVATGAAGSRQLDTLAPRILKGDFTPGFFIKHFIKDMKLAASEAKSEELDLNVLERVLDNYETLAEAGCEEDGTQALIKFYEKCETGKEN